MVLFWITLVLALAGSNAEGELSILHCPDSLKFTPIDETWETVVKEIFSAALGLTVEYDSEWAGLHIVDPFNTPEAAVEVYVDGIAGLGDSAGLKTQKYPLLVDKFEPDTFKGLQLRIKQRFDFGGNEIVNFKLSDVTKFNRIKTVFGKVDGTSYKLSVIPQLVYLKQTVEEDHEFLNELGTLRAVVEKIKDGALNSDRIIDFFSFRFRTLHTLSDFYGPFSNQTKEAMKLLGGALKELSKAFVKAYDGSVLVAVVTTEVAHSRRSARAVTTIPPGHSKKWPYKWLEPQLNREKTPKGLKPERRQGDDDDRPGEERVRDERFGDETSSYSSPSYTRSSPESEYSDDDSTEPGTEPSPKAERSRKNRDDKAKEASLPKYNAATFNLFLVIGVAMWFSMLAIIFALMDMDPGRDTVIYRMTANKSTKKDV